MSKVWDTEWGDIYHTLPPMKWYGVYGNQCALGRAALSHAMAAPLRPLSDLMCSPPALPSDYGQYNRACACDDPDKHSFDLAGAQCAQVQKHGSSHNFQEWYMPAMSYFATPLPGVNLEVVALDTNIVDEHKTCAPPHSFEGSDLCPYDSHSLTRPPPCRVVCVCRLHVILMLPPVRDAACMQLSMDCVR